MHIDEYGKGEASSNAMPPDAGATSLLVRPYVDRPMAGVVSGKSGDKILTDEHGRKKARVHEDRHGRVGESVSYWLRMAETWAGGGLCRDVPPLGRAGSAGRFAFRV